MRSSLGAAILSCTQLNCPSAGTICQQELGPSSVNGDDGRLGYDINAGTGNLFLAYTDIEARPPLGPVLAFRRYYNNQGAGQNVGLGANWTHSYSWAIAVSGGTVASITRDTGQVVQFTLVSGSWVPQVGEYGTLTGTTSTGFTYTTKTGTAYAFDTATNSGRLLSITPADNTAITVNYSGTKILSVTSGTLSLGFSYTGTQITQVSDPIGNDWKYAYTSGNLTSVTFPNNDGSGHYGEMEYGYSNVTVGSTTFDSGTSAGQITEIEVLQSSGTLVPVAYFSYTNPVTGSSQVAAAASGYDSVNAYLLRYVTLSYNLCAGGTFTTTATFPVGTSTYKTITSAATSSLDLPRITSVTSDGGSGVSGENTSESYSWNSNLTLGSFTNGNGYVQSFSSYTNGNPGTIVEAYGTGSARTTTLTYHPVLSRPLTMTRTSVDGSHNHVITWDYDSTYNTGYNATPTTYLHQVVESGYTDSALAGGVGTQRAYTTQIYYDGDHRVTEVDNLVGASPDAGYEKTTLAYYASGFYANYLQTATRYTTASTSLATTYNSYDGDGRPTSVTDSNSTATAYTYDAMGLPTQVQVTQSSNTLTDSYAYDLAEDLLTHTTPEGTTVQMEYDGALRMWREHAQIGSSGTTPWSTVYDFDAWSKPLTVRRFAGLGTDEGAGCTNAGSEQLCKELAYDGYRRVAYERTLDSSNNSCTGSNCKVIYTYDGDGNMASRSEAGANIYTFNRDPLDRVAAVLLPTGRFSTVTYDINDRMITRYDPKSSVNDGGGGGLRETTYLNDDFGRVIKMVNPDVGTEISNYDSFGNLTTSEDGSGAKLNYAYDLLNRRTSLDGGIANDAVTYAYDDETGSIGGTTYTNTAGRLSSVLAHGTTGAVINTHYTYDFAGRLLADLEERGASGSTTFASIQHTWNANGDPATLTYPDGLVATYKYPADGGYAPVPLANEIDVPFQGSPTALVSNVNYFADGVTSSLSFGNGSMRSVGRNMRGEWTSLTSGPSGSPVLSQNYTYDSTGMGELTEVDFFPSQTNAWKWTLGYDSLRRLTAYSTNVRPTSDNYNWTYDAVGNRNSQVYNTNTTTYTYDGLNNTNQLASLSGATSRTWTYDADGDVAQDHFTGAAGTWNQYTYSTRHRPERFDFYSLSTFQYTTETYQNDGLDRRWADVDVSGTWTNYYYDSAGRVLEEYQNNNVTVNGCNAYDIIDHVYLGGGEVSRDVRRFQSDGGGCTSGYYSFVDEDLRYVHEDYRNTVFAVESKAADGGLERIS